MGNTMRLICPECAAQYEVDASVIPEAGRDVQCSNCGHTWWQMRDGARPMPTEAEPQAAASKPAPEPAPEPAPAPKQAEPAVTAGETPAAPPSGVAAAAAAAAPAAVASSPKRSLDDAVLDVLRQEAAREVKARSAEKPAPKEPVEEVKADPEPPSTQGVTAEGVPIAARPRSSRLPDIDEINSTLDGRDTADVEEEEVVAIADGHRRRRGFRVGFLLTLAVAGVLALAYIYAETIAERVPSLRPTLASYTEKVDDARVWLDGAAVRATVAIQGLTSDE